MRAVTLLYTIGPLGTNGALGVYTFVISPNEFTNNLFACYSVALIAAAAGLVSVGGFLRHEISPLRAIASLISQAVALVFVFAGIYRGFGLDTHLDTIKPLVAPDIALYFSVVTWTTLGYGDLAPARGLQLLAALQAGLGYVFLGLIVGLIATLIAGRPNR